MEGSDNLNALGYFMNASDVWKFSRNCTLLFASPIWKQFHISWAVQEILKKKSTRRSSNKRTNVICIILQTYVRLLWISSPKKSFLTTPKAENKQFIWEHLKVLMTWHWRWNFTCVCIINLNNFLELLLEIFWCYFRYLFLKLYLLEHAKRNIIYSFWYKSFVH